MSDPFASTASSNRIFRMVPWVAVGLALAGLIGGELYRRHEAEVERDIALYEKLRAQVHYEAKLYPAKVTFQRGATRQVEHVGKTPFRGLTAEFATSADDSEGAELAEFYSSVDPALLPDQLFVDGSHPIIRSQLQSLFEVEKTDELFRTQIPIKEEDADGWKFRVSLIPSPFGGLAVPEGMPPVVLAALVAKEPGKAPEKGQVDPRLPTASPGIGNTRVDLRAKAEQKLEEKHNSDLRTYDDRHHHYYLVEAVRDYGDGKAVVLRRYGKIYGGQTVARAEQTIRTMAASVTMPQ